LYFVVIAHALFRFITTFTCRKFILSCTTSYHKCDRFSILLHSSLIHLIHAQRKWVQGKHLNDQIYFLLHNSDYLLNP